MILISQQFPDCAENSLRKVINIYLKTSEWPGSISYCIIETTLACHNWDRCRSQLRRFDPIPGVLIGDNDYKTRQGDLHVLHGGGSKLSRTKRRGQDKRVGMGNNKNEWVGNQ